MEATGAPRVFVHVFFNELPPGIAYSVGELDTKISGIQGAIRAGRPLDVKQKLIKRISASWSEITRLPQKQLLAGLNEIDSDVTMEYGLILPHPGGETEWFATNAGALDGIQGTGLSTHRRPKDAQRPSSNPPGPQPPSAQARAGPALRPMPRPVNLRR